MKKRAEICRRYVGDILANPIKAGTSVSEGERARRQSTHTSMGITTYLLIKNKHLIIEKRRLWEMGVRLVRLSVYQSMGITDVHILVIYGSRWAGVGWPECKTMGGCTHLFSEG